MKRHLLSILIACVLALTLPLTLVAEPSKPNVRTAVIDMSTNRITLTGENFGTATPAVALAGTELVVDSFNSATQTIVAILPSVLSPGSYQVTVTARNQAAELAITIGTVGPAGPPGPAGPGFAVCDDVNSGPTCDAPESIGTLSWGAYTSRTGALPAGGSGEKWYSVSWSPSAVENFHPHAYLSAGAAYYVFDVFTNCIGWRPENCATFGFTRDPFSTINWETVHTTAGPYTDTCVDPGQVVYVRVRPLSTNLTCQPYTIVFQNG